MNRKNFLKTSLSIIGVSIWSESYQNKDYPISILLGKGNPKLYSTDLPLLKKAGFAFKEMQRAAFKEGIEIEIVSAYRSFNRQKRIWNRKYLANQKTGLIPEENIDKIIEYSTLPGTSRHHWGTDVDLIDGSKIKDGDLLLTEKFHGKGPYVKMRKWLEENAVNYGFIRPYTDDINRKGFYYEPWHYSYAPIAIPMLKRYLELNLKSLLSTQDLEGSDHLSLTFLARYREENILGIAKGLKSF
jgi:LAS superfamily LD-carboxypeptidase LdcB|tara:strand:- start:1117 stop:1845 length:729 start_codon:yes stop_codon:yes gene_type:complete